MRASSFTESQKAFILKQGEEGTPVAEICRKAGISPSDLFQLKTRYGGLLLDEMRRLKALEDDSSRQKKIVADLTLDQGDVAARHPPKALRPARTRELVDGMLLDWGVSVRRACRALRFAPSSGHDKSRRTGRAAFDLRIREICETRVRQGYRRVHVPRRREGWLVRLKKTRRIYNEPVLRLRNKSPKRRVKAKRRDDRKEALGPNDIWAMDFVHDQLALGNKLRILTVVDTHSRFCPATELRFTCRGEDVVQTPERARHQNESVPTSATQNNQGRQRQRVHLARPRAVGLCQRCHPEFPAPRHANGQRRHRGVQQQASVRMPERALVHEPCRCAG
jgi:transposase InsO family protein